MSKTEQSNRSPFYFERLDPERRSNSRRVTPILPKSIVVPHSGHVPDVFPSRLYEQYGHVTSVSAERKAMQNRTSARATTDTVVPAMEKMSQQATTTSHVRIMSGFDITLNNGMISALVVNPMANKQVKVKFAIRGPRGRVIKNRASNAVPIGRVTGISSNVNPKGKPMKTASPSSCSHPQQSCSEMYRRRAMFACLRSCLLATQVSVRCGGVYNPCVLLSTDYRALAYLSLCRSADASGRRRCSRLWPRPRSTSTPYRPAKSSSPAS